MVQIYLIGFVQDCKVEPSSSVARARDSKSLRRGFDSHLGFHERRIMKTLIVFLSLLLFMFVGTAIAKDVYINRPDRNYSPSTSIWTPEPGDKVYMCIGCMVKLYETEKLWKVIAFNGMTYTGQVPTLNFDLCYFQKDIPDCMDIFIVKSGSNLTGHVFAIRFFKFKILKIDTDALHLEFVGFMDEKEPDLKPLPQNDDDKEEPESKL